MVFSPSHEMICEIQVIKFLSTIIRRDFNQGKIDGSKWKYPRQHPPGSIISRN